jgi:phenylalanyl-tRNA synthetase beta chain
LAGAGLSQAVNLSFMSREDLDALGYPPEHAARGVVTVKNPLREEEANLRTTLVAGLLRSARYNVAHGADSVALFETGKVFFNRPDPDDPRIPDQPDRLGFVLVGGFGPVALDGRSRPVDVFVATAVWRLVADRLGLTNWSLHPTPTAGFHPGRCAEVHLGGTAIGSVGELHPKAAQAFELPGRVVVGELELGALVGPVAAALLRTPSTFPPVEFDLAFLVDRDVPATRLLAVTVGAGSDLVASARVFDEYSGRSDGRKSLAIRYELRAPDRTLTNEEVAPIQRAMVDAAASVGAELRGRL